MTVDRAALIVALIVAIAYLIARAIAATVKANGVINEAFAQLEANRMRAIRPDRTWAQICDDEQVRS